MHKVITNKILSILLCGLIVVAAIFAFPISSIAKADETLETPSPVMDRVLYSIDFDIKEHEYFSDYVFGHSDCETQDKVSFYNSELYLQVQKGYFRHFFIKVPFDNFSESGYFGFSFKARTTLTINGEDQGLIDSWLKKFIKVMHLELCIFDNDTLEETDSLLLNVDTVTSEATRYFADHKDPENEGYYLFDFDASELDWVTINQKMAVTEYDTAYLCFGIYIDASKMEEDFFMIIDDFKFGTLAHRYNLTYKADGEKLENFIVKDGENLYGYSLSVAAPIKEGYLFKGWSLTDGGELVDLATFSVQEDTVLYAIYSDANKTGSISLSDSTLRTLKIAVSCALGLCVVIFIVSIIPKRRRR